MSVGGFIERRQFCGGARAETRCLALIGGRLREDRRGKGVTATSASYACAVSGVWARGAGGATTNPFLALSWDIWRGQSFGAPHHDDRGGFGSRLDAERRYQDEVRICGTQGLIANPGEWLGPFYLPPMASLAGADLLRAVVDGADDLHPHVLRDWSDDWQDLGLDIYQVREKGLLVPAGRYAVLAARQGKHGARDERVIAAVDAEDEASLKAWVERFRGLYVALLGVSQGDGSALNTARIARGGGLAGRYA